MDDRSSSSGAHAVLGMRAFLTSPKDHTGVVAPGAHGPWFGPARGARGMSLAPSGLVQRHGDHVHEVADGMLLRAGAHEQPELLELVAVDDQVTVGYASAETSAGWAL